MDAENMEKGIRLNLKSSLPPLHKHLNLNEDLFVETSKSVLLETPMPTLATKPISAFESLQPTSTSPVLLKPALSVSTTLKMEEVEKTLPSKTVPEKKELNFLLNKNKMNKSIKNSEFYKYFLYFLALIVMLYLTRNYWWKYVTKKFFPSEEKKDELKLLEKDLTGSEVDFFDVNNVQEVIELEDKDSLNVRKPAKYAKVLLIYANWCGHCKDMMKAYEDAAKVLHEKSKTSENKVVFMRAESSRAPKLANAPNIQGFPTIVGIFQNGKEFPYNGPRNMESFIKFADLIAIGGLPPVSSESAGGTGLDVPKPRVLPKRVVPKVEEMAETKTDMQDELLVPSFQETLDADLKDDVDDEKSEPVLSEHVTELEVQELVKKTLENIDKLKESQETSNYSYFGDDGGEESEKTKEVLEKQVEVKRDTPSIKKTKVKKDLKL